MIFVGILISLMLFLAIVIPPVDANVLIYGSVPNYSAIILPNNSYVHQGENISQRNYYDLRGVYGFSGELAHWNNDDLVGRGQPDQIVSLSGRGFTYIDPTVFPVGRWWQWDGQYCNSDGYCTTGFGNGNAYVFYVTPAEQQSTVQERVIVQAANITISQNGSTIQIPVTYTQVQTYYGTPIPTQDLSGSGTIIPSFTETSQPTIAGPINPDVQDQNGISIPGGVSGAVVVTPKSPVPLAVPIFAIIIGLIAMWRKKWS